SFGEFKSCARWYAGEIHGYFRPSLTSQANNEGELVYRRANWECLVHQRGLSSAGGLFYFFLRFMGALIFLIGAVRFFNLASPAALLTLVGRNKTPDKPLGALP
ncbi:hypothetical protein QOU60_23080, partial [Pseudomonas aeruginosa]